MIFRLPKGSTKKLAKNFRAYEFDCHCDRCQETIVDLELVEKLQAKRDEWGKAIHIISGFRCPSHNKDPNVKGAKKSQHLLGKAADIVVYGWTPYQVKTRCEDFGGLGWYPRKGFVHVDVRKKKARWQGLT